jgi:hypothetical protein
MNFGIDKCKICSIKKGKLTKHEGSQLASEQVIWGMNTNECFKYLGFIQTPIIDHHTIKCTIIQKYKAHLTQLLKTNLNGRNIMTAINMYTMPLITYTFGIIKWTNTDLNNLNALTRTTCTKFQKHHQHTTVERFTLPRKERGRGCIDILNAHHKQIENLRQYFKS